MRVAYACSGPRLRVRYRPTDPATPFPPPCRRAVLSAFPPVAEKGRFPPVIVVDIQAKRTPPRGLRPAVRRPVVRSAVSKSGPPALLDDAVEAILATARSPSERDRRGMVDIALVLALRDCGLRRSEAAAPGWNRVLGGGCEPVNHVDGFLLFWHCCGFSKVVSGSDGESWRFAGVVCLCIREPPGWCRRFYATLVLAQERIVACLPRQLAPLVHSYEHAYGCDYHAEGHGPSAVE